MQSKYDEIRFSNYNVAITFYQYIQCYSGFFLFVDFQYFSVCQFNLLYFILIRSILVAFIFMYLYIYVVYEYSILLYSMISSVFVWLVSLYFRYNRAWSVLCSLFFYYHARTFVWLSEFYGDKKYILNPFLFIFYLCSVYFMLCLDEIWKFMFWCVTFIHCELINCANYVNLIFMYILYIFSFYILFHDFVFKVGLTHVLSFAYYVILMMYTRIYREITEPIFVCVRVTHSANFVVCCFVSDKLIGQQNKLNNIVVFSCFVFYFCNVV